MIGLTQDIRKKPGKYFGDEISIKLWKDKDFLIKEIDNILL